MNYKLKYLKYKIKYYLQKDKYGGMSKPDHDNEINKHAKISKIKMIWDALIRKVFHERTNNPNFDGLTFWRNLKPILTQIQANDIVWNSENIQNIKNNVEIKYFSSNNILDESIISEKDEDEKIIEPIHFFLQLFRIPIQNEPSFKKLMQVALNYGQQSNELKNRLKLAVPEIDNNFIDEIYTYQSKYGNINTYMTNDSLKKFNLSDENFTELIKKLEINTNLQEDHQSELKSANN